MKSNSRRRNPCHAVHFHATQAKLRFDTQLPHTKCDCKTFHGSSGIADSPVIHAWQQQSNVQQHLSMQVVRRSGAQHHGRRLTVLMSKWGSAGATSSWELATSSCASGHCSSMVDWTPEAAASVDWSPGSPEAAARQPEATAGSHQGMVGTYSPCNT